MMNDDIWTYYQLSLSKYRGTLTEALGIMKTVPAARQLAAEMVYVYEHQHVPEWAVHIEYFAKTGNGYVFAHRATYTA